MAEQFMVPMYRLELVRERYIPYTSVSKIEAAAQVFHQMLDKSPVEKMAVIHCNTGLDMIGAEVVAVGSMEMVGAAMVDLFRGAIRNNAARIWLAHNHVDGRVQASQPDFLYTVRAVDIGDMLGLPVHDHLVIGPGAYYSIFEHRAELNALLDKLEREMLKQQILGMLPVPGLPGVPRR